MWYFVESLKSPVQELYLNLGEDVMDAKFNQSFFIRLGREKEIFEIASAVDTLVRHHSMLRARFVNQDGQWKQKIVADAQTSLDFNVHEVKQAQAADEMASVIAKTQAKINPLTGPLFAVDLFQVGGEEVNLRNWYQQN